MSLDGSAARAERRQAECELIVLRTHPSDVSPALRLFSASRRALRSVAASARDMTREERGCVERGIELGRVGGAK